MIVTTVHVYVKTDRINDFINACVENHNASVKEPGNLRFDILQSTENETEFTLYEAYDSIESSKAHKETEHYNKWKNTVADWMEKPRSGKPHRVIAPVDIKKWK